MNLYSQQIVMEYVERLNLDVLQVVDGVEATAVARAIDLLIGTAGGLTPDVAILAQSVDDGESEQCQRCGDSVGLVWHAPDEVWERVTGVTDGSGIFCVRCFNQMAWEVDVFLYWECAVDHYPTLFPSHRAGEEE